MNLYFNGGEASKKKVFNYNEKYNEIMINSNPFLNNELKNYSNSIINNDSLEGQSKFDGDTLNDTLDGQDNIGSMWSHGRAMTLLGPMHHWVHYARVD